LLLRQVCELHVLDEDELDELHDVVNMDCRDGKKGRDDAHTYLDVDIDMVPGNVQHDELADTHMVAGRVLDEHTYVLVQQGKRARGDGLELPQHGKRADGDELELALHGKLFQDERLLGRVEELHVDEQVLDVVQAVDGIGMDWDYGRNYRYEDVHEEMQ